MLLSISYIAALLSGPGIVWATTPESSAQQLLPMKSVVDSGTAVEFLVGLPPQSADYKTWKLSSWCGEVADGELAPTATAKLVSLAFPVSGEGLVVLTLHGPGGQVRISADATIRVNEPKVDAATWLTWIGGGLLALAGAWQFWIKEWLGWRERRELVRCFVAKRIKEARQAVYVCRIDVPRLKLTVLESDLTFLRVLYRPDIQACLDEVDRLLDEWRELNAATEETQRFQQSQRIAARLEHLSECVKHSRPIAV